MTVIGEECPVVIVLSYGSNGGKTRRYNNASLMTALASQSGHKIFISSDERR